ncbi:hypothetical protein RFI_02077 [Reticulomyxa filosa]|uniref:Endonuclease/exonuclease/phosphatase domain-containing protein n=1 Tax=Reticulomyxa filosa TaxID=46433 RepID=X6PA38_RETFI|nr:hypothetical protein RFI_02077 [Reticulomyxa filosa]|eukprot:ETO34998.1 hypothetical protein RFI_02077 [Reticulomyxa filosa]
MWNVGQRRRLTERRTQEKIKINRLQNKKSDDDEILSLRLELAEIKLILRILICKQAMINSILVLQNNNNGFYYKVQILEQNLHQKQSQICLLQEVFRSKKKDIDYNFHFYRNLTCNRFNIQSFEQELQSDMKMTEYIVIGVDWNAYHLAWLYHNIDDTVENILDFIVSNGLHIINTLPFDYTFMKGNATLSIDITLCSSYILPLISNWRTYDVELDVQSNHLPTKFNIKTMWSSLRIKRQKIGI